MVHVTRKFLEKRLVELNTEIADMRKRIQPLESELADVKRALGVVRDDRPSENLRLVRRPVVTSSSSPYQQMTLKQLIIKALKEHFPDGATANELIDFFSVAWDRDIQRTSLSPQLSRLKDEGQVRLENNKWFLPLGTRLFSREDEPTRTQGSESVGNLGTEEENSRGKQFFFKSKTQTPDKDPG